MTFETDVINGIHVIGEEDVTNMKSVLPRLKEVEKERKIEEIKEKERKERERKDGPPENMTVVLLKQVLRELNISFNPSSSKKELILQVEEARKNMGVGYQCNRHKSFFYSSSNMTVCTEIGRCICIDLELDKTKRLGLFWACLYFLAACCLYQLEYCIS